MYVRIFREGHRFVVALVHRGNHRVFMRSGPYRQWRSALESAEKLAAQLGDVIIWLPRAGQWQETR